MYKQHTTRTRNITFLSLFRVCRQLQGRLQGLPQPRLWSASSSQLGSGHLPARQRLCPAVHVRHRHPGLPELLRSELNDFASDSSETPEHQIKLQLQAGEPTTQQRSGPQPRAAAPADCNVETLVDLIGLPITVKRDGDVFNVRKHVEITSLVNTHSDLPVCFRDEKQQFVAKLVEYYILVSRASLLSHIG